MTLISNPPTQNSIFQFPPNFPNGQVSDAWVAWFQEVQANNYVFPAALTGFALGWDAGGNLINVANTGADQTAQWTAADNLIRSDLAASGGAGLVGYLAPYTGAVATTQSQLNTESVSLFRWMTAAEIADFISGAKTIDVTAKINTALSSGAKYIVWPEGDPKVTATLVVPSGVVVDFKGTLTKQFNGDMITLGAMSTLKNAKLDGVGATYTGRGVVVSTGDLDNVSWRKFINCDILNMASHCIEFTAPRAGYSSMIENCRLTLDGANKYVIGCVKLPSGENATLNGNRFMSGCFTFGYRMFDAGQCDNFVVTNCQGAAPILNPLSLKISMTNCRIVNVGDSSLANWTIDGQFGTYNSLVVGLNVVFASTCANVKWDNITYAGTITDNATGMANGNEIYYLSQFSFTPVWTGGSPSIGNGVLSCVYVRRGAMVHVDITLQIGSTTNVGSGAWTLTLPFTCNRPTVGKAFLVNAAGTTLYQGAFLVASGTNVVQVITNFAANAYVGSAQPWAWANGDKMYLSIEYQIQ